MPHLKLLVILGNQPPYPNYLVPCHHSHNKEQNEEDHDQNCSQSPEGFHFPGKVGRPVDGFEAPKHESHLRVLFSRLVLVGDLNLHLGNLLHHHLQFFSGLPGFLNLRWE